jgi:hypothetical protein
MAKCDFCVEPNAKCAIKTAFVFIESLFCVFLTVSLLNVLCRLRLLRESVNTISGLKSHVTP